MSKVQAVPSLFLILLGSMDCLTTVIGTVYFGASELNPLLVGLVSSNIPAFIFVKLTVTILVGLIFILAEKTLLRTGSTNTRSVQIARRILRIACISLLLFLAIVVVNNILVLLKIIV